MEEEIVQYFVVNKDLNMSSGKIAAQVAHVATIITLHMVKEADMFFEKWFNTDQKKIILRGKQKDLEKLVELGFDYIKDNGLTEIPANSLTCVGFPPRPKSELQKFVKRLQLL